MSKALVKSWKDSSKCLNIRKRMPEESSKENQNDIAFALSGKFALSR